MPNEWFIRNADQVKGPLSDQQVKQLAALGQITPATHIRLGTGAWATASSVRGLFPPPSTPAPQVDEFGFGTPGITDVREERHAGHEHAALASGSTTRTCPFCSEEIKSSAVKCKHCGEFLGKQSTNEPLNRTEAATVLHDKPRRPSGLERTAPPANSPKPTTVSCSSRYLRVRCVFELALVAWIAATCVWCLQGAFTLRWSHWAIGLAVFLILGGLVLLRFKCLSMYRFAFDSGEIRTRKVFTSHRNVTTPAHQIQSISAHEGVLEALLGVGTIEISTASSRHDHAVYTWPHIQDARRVAEEMRVAVASKE
jgi:membrane protein YdbS with pleckstrin-like domain